MAPAKGPSKRDAGGQGQRRRHEDKQKWSAGQEATGRGTWQPLEAGEAEAARFSPKPLEGASLLMASFSPGGSMGFRAIARPFCVVLSS